MSVNNIYSLLAFSLNSFPIFLLPTLITILYCQPPGPQRSELLHAPTVVQRLYALTYEHWTKQLDCRTHKIQTVKTFSHAKHIPPGRAVPPRRGSSTHARPRTRARTQTPSPKAATGMHLTLTHLYVWIMCTRKSEAVTSRRHELQW